MFGGISHKLSMLRQKATPDVTPDPVNWLYNYRAVIMGEKYCDFTEQRITGISQTITLSIDFDVSYEWVYYRVASTPSAYSRGSLIEATAYQYQADINNDGVFRDDDSPFTIQVSNGDYVGFAWYPLMDILNNTLFVTNSSDNNTLLDDIDNRTQDTEPNPVSWNDVSAFPAPLVTNTQTISGISTPITLRIDFVENYDGLSLEYSKNNGAYQAISNGGTFTVSNADTLKFRVPSGLSGAQIIFNVVNQSESDAILDTITLEITSF